MTDHLSELTAAAFVDGTLSRPERARAEQHLADCEECRREVVDVANLVRPRRRLPTFALPLAAAAAVILLAVGITGRERGSGEVFRAGAQPAAVRPSTPADNSVVATEPLFTWHPVSNAIQYRVTVTNAVGDVVTEKITTDTTVLVQLASARSFKWYVTATLRDGSVLASPALNFLTQ